jgi:RNA polymerase sigma-70 factor (ECF subfamily)
MAQPLTDVELVPLAMAGDIDAFERLFATYNAYIRRVAGKHAAGDLVDDTAQLVWLWLLLGRWRLQALPRTATLFAFLGRLTHYALAALRWQERHPTFVPWPEDEDDGPVPILLDSPTPETIVLREERRDRLREAIRRLPAPYRRCAHLRYLDDMSGPDIAVCLGVEPQTIPGYLYQIRRHLRRALADVYLNLPQPIPGRRGGGQRIERAEKTCR